MVSLHYLGGKLFSDKQSCQSRAQLTVMALDLCAEIIEHHRADPQFVAYPFSRHGQANCAVELIETSFVRFGDETMEKCRSSKTIGTPDGRANA